MNNDISSLACLQDIEGFIALKRDLLLTILYYILYYIFIFLYFCIILYYILYY